MARKLKPSPLREFLNQNKEYGHVEEIKLNDSSFNFYGVNIGPLTIEY